MRIAVASDHRGYFIKNKILALLGDLGHEPLDYGTNSEQSCDYPDFACGVAAAVSSGEVDRGILICGTGMGMCIVANKYRGVRAASCHDDLTVEMSRRHNDANVLCLSADLLGDRLVNRMVELWLRTAFEAGRHQRRLEKITQIEAQSQPVSPAALPRAGSSSPTPEAND